MWWGNWVNLSAISIPVEEEEAVGAYENHQQQQDQDQYQEIYSRRQRFGYSGKLLGNMLDIQIVKIQKQEYIKGFKIYIK